MPSRHYPDSSWAWVCMKKQLQLSRFRMTMLFIAGFPPSRSTWWCDLRIRKDRLSAWKKAHSCPHSIKTRHWEFCLSSNGKFDPRIWCITVWFYCFCINAEKWPPCLLNHTKHLNLSSPPACLGKNPSYSPMTAWKYSAKQLYRLALLLLTLESLQFLRLSNLEEIIIYSMCVASNHLDTLCIFNCWFPLYFHIKWSSFAVAKWCSHRASPF